MFPNILVPLDGSTLAEAILPHVRVMAAAFGARVSLLHVLETPAPGSVNLFDWHMRRAEAEVYLREQTACLQETGVDVNSELVEGPAADRIVEYADKQRASLIILSSHGRGGPSEWNVSHIAQKVLQRGTTSILLIPAGEARHAFAEETGYRRILAPLDGSRRAECVLPVARTLVEQQDAGLFLVHVTTRPFVFHRLPFTMAERASMGWLVSHNRARAEKYLQQLAAGISGAVGTAVPVGDSVAVTLHQVVAEEAADLVLLSAHGHSSQSQWPYGGLVSNFIAYGSVPLLIVQDLPQPLSQQRHLQSPRRLSRDRSAERTSVASPAVTAGDASHPREKQPQATAASGYRAKQETIMKRKPVYAHRTRKMREDFLQWVVNRKDGQQQRGDTQIARTEPSSPPALMAWADDGGSITAIDSSVSPTRPADKGER